MAFAIIQLRTWLSSVVPDRDDDRGASLVEYALLLALIAIVCVVARQRPRRAPPAKASTSGAGMLRRRPLTRLDVEEAADRHG